MQAEFTVHQRLTKRMGPTGSQPSSMALLLSADFRGSMLVLCVVWFALSFGSYGLGTYITTLFEAIGLTDPYRCAFVYAAVPAGTRHHCTPSLGFSNHRPGVPRTSIAFSPGRAAGRLARLDWRIPASSAQKGPHLFK